MITSLFVYGTLRPGQERWQHLAPFVIDEGHDDSVIGVLYNTGNGYPAARFIDRGSIQGRVYALSPNRLDECLQSLDDVEGAVLDLFGRVAVITCTGLEVWAYEYGGHQQFPEIASGNWLLESW